jgi:hypothetical protein
MMQLAHLSNDLKEIFFKTHWLEKNLQTHPSGFLKTYFNK